MSRGFQIPPGPISLAISAKIRAVAGEKRINQITLARATSISATQMSQLWRDEKGFDIEQLDRVCYALDLLLTDVIRDAEQLSRSRFAEPAWVARRA